MTEHEYSVFLVILFLSSMLGFLLLQSSRALCTYAKYHYCFFTLTISLIQILTCCGLSFVYLDGVSFLAPHAIHTVITSSQYVKVPLHSIAVKYEFNL